MLKTRQPELPTPAYSEAGSHGRGTLAHGFHVEAHSHQDGQLVYAASGLLATITERGTWVALADRITWTPPGFVHSHRFYGETDVRILGIPRELCGALANQPGVFAVSPLVREALLALTDREAMRTETYERLRAVVIDELVVSPDQSIHLPEARDDRLRAVTEFLRTDPGQAATLAELGRGVGASERTLSRLFHDELGMSFHRWRTILRVHYALVQLDEGRPVTAIATECGWANPTSFIEAFTAIVGTTPGRYRKEMRDTQGERPPSGSRP